MSSFDVDTITSAAHPAELLHTVALSLSRRNGNALFHEQLAQIAALLNARHAYLYEVVGADASRLLASWQDDLQSASLTYCPQGIACAELNRDGVQMVERALGKRFPDDMFILDHGFESYLGCPLIDVSKQTIGYLSVYSDQCITEPDTASALMTLFAIGISAELQHQRCRQQLKDHEQFLQTLLGNLPGMAFSGAIDRRWTMWFVSDGCEPLTGYPREVFEKGKLGWADIIHPDERDYVWSEMHQRLAAGERFEIEYRILTRTSEEKWVREQGCGVNKDNGKFASIEGVIIDITPQMTFQLALARSEAYFKTIVDTAVESIITIDGQGRIQTFNKAAEHLFGYAADEVIGNNIRMLMPEPHRQKHDQYIHNYLKTGESKIIGRGLEIQGLRKDCSLVPIHLSVNEIALNGSRGFAGIIRDLTEERTALESLRQEHELLNAIVEQAPTGIITYCFGEPIKSANLAACDMLGYTLEELRAMTMLDLLHPEDRAEGLIFTARAAIGTLDEFSPRKRFVRKDGSTLDAQVVNAVTHNANGQPALLIRQMTDLTPRLKAEAQAREHLERLAHADRLNTLGEMMAGIAHEINQPLTAISLFAQAGKRLYAAGDYDKAQDLFDKLSQHAHRAGAVIERMQAMARQRESSKERVDCNRLITHVSKLAEAEARFHNIDIDIVTSDEELTVDVDTVQIEQVVLNLLRNGMDAMRTVACRDGKTIWLQTRRRNDGDVEVAVIDSGEGVSKETAKKLFIPFSTTKDSGMGLGLSISRTIITAHGGQLTFHNNLSGGATFYFTLPAARQGV